VRTNSRLWGIRYDRKLEDLMAMEEEICREVASRLRLSLEGEDKERLGKRRTSHPAADIAYRRGRLLYSKQTPESLERSIERFQEAINIDSSFVLAHVGLAEAWISLGYFQNPKVAYANATGYAQRALDLDPLLGEAHAAIGTLRLFEWDWPEARRSLDRALELNPRCAETFPCFLHSLDALGQADEAQRYVERALKLNPESSILLEELGCTSYYAGRYEDSVRHSEEAIELDPGFVLALYNLGRAQGALRRYDQSIATLEKAKAASGGEVIEVLAELAYSHAMAGRKDVAVAILEELLARKKRVFVDPYPLAFAQIGLDDKQNALASLEEAVDQRSSWTPWLKVEPKFFVLHSEPRFRSLLERLKL